MTATLTDILSSHQTRRPVVMGILNVTPDSFSDGGQFLAPPSAIAQAEAMVAAGADILDLGAESTRPGSERVSPDEQIRRLKPILPIVCGLPVTVSIDTTSARVAQFALDAGAAIINDVSAGREDPDLLAVAAQAGAPVVLMHMLGQPKSMQTEPRYDDVVAEVCDFLAQRIEAAVAAGVDRARCIVDPGIGFGKTLQHNLLLLSHTAAICELGAAVLIGPSRKRFISDISDIDTADRLGGTLAALCATYLDGASIFRVHDVGPARQALDVLARIAQAG